VTNISHSTQVESVTTSRVRWRCLQRSRFHAEKVDCAQEAEAAAHGTNAEAGEQAAAAGATVSGTAQARALDGYCGVCLRAQTWPHLPDKQGRRVDELGHRGGNCSERHGGCGEEEAGPNRNSNRRIATKCIEADKDGDQKRKKMMRHATGDENAVYMRCF
jgi:hypothetical protein